MPLKFLQWQLKIITDFFCSIHIINSTRTLIVVINYYKKVIVTIVMKTAIIKMELLFLVMQGLNYAEQIVGIQK